MLSRPYLIRGLRVASDLPLGAFPRVEGVADAVVRLGPASALAVRPSRPGCFEVRAGQKFFGTVGGGVVLVRHGWEILVDSRPGVDRAALVKLVVDEGIEALLHQRAAFPPQDRGRSFGAGRAPAFTVEEMLS